MDLIGTGNYITGSWHPTGFHGHFRSKLRNDFQISYRHFAKPIPPTKFESRSQVRSDNHLFSQHDNRNVHASSMGDLEMHFSMGLGKKKPHSSASQHHKPTVSLLTWNNNMNRNNTVTSSCADTCKLQTTYNNSFRNAMLVKKSEEFERFQTKYCNQSVFIRQEPVHSRKNPNLQRRLLTVRQNLTDKHPPLLAWGIGAAEVEINNMQNFKPCIGDSTKRTVPRRSYSSGIQTQTHITKRLNPITWSIL